MNLWILRPKEGLPKDQDANPWEPWYDKAHGFIVRAKTEEDARKIAVESAGDEGDMAWLSPDFSTCKVLSAKGKTCLVMQDYRAA